MNDDEATEVKEDEEEERKEYSQITLDQNRKWNWRSRKCLKVFDNKNTKRVKKKWEANTAKIVEEQKRV